MGATHAAQLLLPLPSFSRAAADTPVVPRLGMLRMGDRLACSARFGVFRPCDACGSAAFVVEAGRGPHAGLLRCEQCGRANRWLSRNYLEEQT
jgi:hypothetical protein